MRLERSVHSAVSGADPAPRTSPAQPPTRLTRARAALACPQACRSKPTAHRTEKREECVSKHRFLKASLVGLPILVLVAAASHAQQQAPGSDLVQKLTPVTDAMLRNPPPGDWLMWRRTYNAF